MNSENIQTKWGQFLSLITVFFFWGFVGSANDILIPVFKKVFTLSQVQSQLVAWAFYVAYFVGSMIFFLVSLKVDVLQRFGYKKTLSAGLVLSAIGSFLFVPAATMQSFPFFLTGLFTVGLGFSIQQIVANPLAIKMGSAKTGAHRLTLAGGVNSFGTTIGAILLGIALFGMGDNKKSALSLEDIKMPFIILGLAFIAVAIFMYFSRIENPAKQEQTEVKAIEKKFNIFDYPQLYLGMLAIFIYVGTEVTIVSNLPALLKTLEFGSISEDSISPFISLYWGSLMIGRLNGGINVFNTTKLVNRILKFLVPTFAFGVIIGVNVLAGHSISEFYIYPLWMLLFIFASFIGGKNAGKTLMLFGFFGLLMMLIGLVYPEATIAKFFFISGGLFLSIMWPSIFDLAIAGLGKNTGKASSFLIMMIFGGGVVPLLQGSICDIDLTNPNGVLGISWTHFSYIVPLLGFAYLGFYGFYCPKILKKQNIDYKTTEGGGH